MNNTISIQAISKKYGKIDALQDINLEVNKGELFGLIGPDGAGKTTLIRILTTLIKASTGSASVNGWDVLKDYRSIRRHIGYMPGVFALYKDLTVQENLNFFATVFGSTIEKNYDLIAPIYNQIEAFKDRRAGKLSGGMKQKLALSCALIHRPKVLFLDEPTTGVDAVSRQEFWDMLQNMKNHAITVFVSTPYMDEAVLCDRIALIQKGKILDIATPAEVISNFSKILIRVKSNDRYKLLQDLRSYPAVDSVYPFGEFTHATFLEDISLSDIEAYLDDKGHNNYKVEYAEVDIEDRFIELMDNN